MAELSLITLDEFQALFPGGRQPLDRANGSRKVQEWFGGLQSPTSESYYPKFLAGTASTVSLNVIDSWGNVEANYLETSGPPVAMESIDLMGPEQAIQKPVFLVRRLRGDVYERQGAGATAASLSLYDSQLVQFITVDIPGPHFSSR